MGMQTQKCDSRALTFDHYVILCKINVSSQINNGHLSSRVGISPCVVTAPEEKGALRGTHTKERQEEAYFNVCPDWCLLIDFFSQVDR